MDRPRRPTETPGEHLPRLLGSQPLNSAAGMAPEEGEFVLPSEEEEYDLSLGADASPPELAFLLGKRKHIGSERPEAPRTVLDTAYHVAVSRNYSTDSDAISFTSSAPSQLSQQGSFSFHLAQIINPPTAESFKSQEFGPLYTRRMPELVNSSMHESREVQRSNSMVAYPAPLTPGVNSWWMNDFLASFDKVIAPKQFYFS